MADVFGNAFDYAEDLSVFGNVFWWEPGGVEIAGCVYDAPYQQTLFVAGEQQSVYDAPYQETVVDVECC